MFAVHYTFVTISGDSTTPCTRPRTPDCDVSRRGRYTGHRVYGP